MNLYAILDLQPTATYQQIKQAFRKKAKQHHPDKGGSSKDFDAIMRANIVLSDPDRRRKYDATGEVDDDAVDNTHAKAVSAIVGVISAIVGQHPDPVSLDLVAEVRKFFKQQITQHTVNQAAPRAAAEKMRKVEKRFKVKPRAAMIKLALLAQAKAADEQVAAMEREIIHCRLCLELLTFCSFDAVRPPESDPRAAYRRGYGVTTGAR